MEVKRQLDVLDLHLADNHYMCTDEYTIADMICYPWTAGWKIQDQDIDEFKYFKRWFEELSARDAVQRGMAVGKDMGDDPAKLSDEEKARRRAMLYNQRARPAPA